MKQIALGWVMYAQDYDETLCYRPSGNAIGPGAECSWRYVCDNPASRTGSYINWWHVVEPYTKNHQIIACPSAIPVPNLVNQGWTATNNIGIGLNAYPDWGLTRGPAIPTPFGGNIYPGVTLAAITKPAQTVLISDAGYLTYRTYWETWPRNGLNKNAGASPWVAPRPEFESGSEWAPDPRHNGVNGDFSGVANVGFVDGHVKSMKMDAFYLGWNGIWFRADRDRVMPGDPPNLPR
jgi:prepilin-type processing-associated H-X9-DG protein